VTPTPRLPWERFTTPQAAYEWAKACGGGLMLARSPRGRGWWVLQLQEDMTWASRLHATTTRLGLLAITPEGIR
jgi:hypothetical protein